MILIGAEEVAKRLDHGTCIGLVREAMIALSKGRCQQPLRGVIDLGGGNAFGVMPGALEDSVFGAKLISVYAGRSEPGRSHQGVFVLFDRATGKPSAIIDAGELTAIRTACASAAATDVLARRNARRLAIFGTGEQAWHHAVAIPYVREVSDVVIWGRSPAKAEALADRIRSELALSARWTESATEAALEADIICTTTAASEPVLNSRDVVGGTHINLVGSSRVGPVEIDTALVSRARFFPDHREGVLAQGAEILRAVSSGLVTGEHVLPEIGAVFTGDVRGRTSDDDVTIYKSLGSVAQDLACAAFLASGAAGDRMGDKL